MTTPAQEALAALERVEDLARHAFVPQFRDLDIIRAALEESGRDAERYRWLRSKFGSRAPYLQDVIHSLCDIWPQQEVEVDEAIDAARAAEGG